MVLGLRANVRLRLFNLRSIGKLRSFPRKRLRARIMPKDSWEEIEGSKVISNMAKYQGHKNYNHWNVCLWIGNDENLYRIAKTCISHSNNKRDAARLFVSLMKENETAKTGDGIPYSLSSVRAAMVGL